MIIHDLHIEVGKAFTQISLPLRALRVELDEACVVRTPISTLQHLPFFLSITAGNDTEITNVDLMVLKNNKVTLVCEIDESDTKPTRIFGKIFTAASAVMCKLKSGAKYDLDKNGIFVQILSPKALKVGRSKKIIQGQNIEMAINTLIKKGGSWIKQYYLIYGDVDNFKPGNNGYNNIEKIVKGL